MKILVTGISGLLGPYISEAFRKYSHFFSSQILGIYNSNVPKYNSCNLLKMNLADNSSLEDLVNDFDFIIHCAAATDVNRCEIDEVYCRLNNVDITKNLISFAKKNNSKLVYISTEAVFYDILDAKEEDIPNPHTVYGKTKLEAENIVKEYENHVIIRTTLFGRSLNGFPKLFEHLYNNLSENQEVKAISDNLFNPITTNELSRIIVEICKADLKGTFHVNSDESLSRYQLYSLMAETFDLDKSKIISVPMESINSNVPRSKFATLDCSKIKKYLNLNEISLTSQIKNIKNEIK